VATVYSASTHTHTHTHTRARARARARKWISFYINHIASYGNNC